MAAEDYETSDDSGWAYDGIFVPCEFVHETEKAVLVSQDGKKAWFPKSQVQPASFGDERGLEMPSWLHTQKVPDWKWDSP